MPEYLHLLLYPVSYCLLDIIGLILAMIYYRRAPGACNFVIGASLLHLVAAIGNYVWFRMGIIENRAGFEIVSIALSIMNLVAYALLISAAFVGRNDPTQRPGRATRRERRDEDAEWDDPTVSKPAPKTTDSTGIEEHRP